MTTCLREAAPAKAGNAAGGFFQQPTKGSIDAIGGWAMCFRADSRPFSCNGTPVYSSCAAMWSYIRFARRWWINPRLGVEQRSRDDRVGDLPTFPRCRLDVEQFGVRPATAQRRYQTFVAEGLGQPGPWKHLRGQLYLGDDKFVAKHQPGRALKEISRQHTQAVRQRRTALLQQKHTPKQSLAEGYRTHGYQIREIADHLDLHYSTVSRRMRQAEEAGAGLQDLIQ